VIDPIGRGWRIAGDMRIKQPTGLDAARYRLNAAEYFRRASEAATPEARKRLEALAREFVALAEKAERAITLRGAPGEPRRGKGA
jgi:hypothetical protein